MKLFRLFSVLSGLCVLPIASAASLDNIQVWAGSGTNRAAMVIHWSAPEVRNSTSVPNPAAEKSLVWGYRWNGQATASDMFAAIVAADHRLFVGTSTPYPGFGPFVFCIGYDLNNNGVFGIRIGTNVITGSAFTNGLRILPWGGMADGAASLDAGDTFWSGEYGANWESWQEQGGVGGFTSAPDRGPNPYWTTGDTNYFSFGTHGEWSLASGLETISLKDGSWLGFSVAGGGLNYSDPNHPGTIANNLRKQAPVSPEPASLQSPFAVQVIAQGPFDVVPYDDPNSALGQPSTRYYEYSALPSTRVKLVEPAYNYAPDRTNKLMVTLKSGSSIIARFDHPVLDNPANPYGIDFQVFGNAFFSGSSLVDDTSDMNTFPLGAAVFAEPMKVSVSPGYTGKPGEDPNLPATWPWYRYESGPYCDTAFPSHAFKWNRDGTNWTEELMDFTKPVNPALSATFSRGGLKAADGIDLYAGSGGGTGFDLKPSGFASVQYVRVEGLPGYDYGELDAFSIVRCPTVGDTLSIAPDNIAAGTGALYFQRPGAENQKAVSINFTSISDIGRVTTACFDDSAALTDIVGTPVNAVTLELLPILGTGSVSLRGSLALSADAGYSGNGGDLRVWQRNDIGWVAKDFTYNATNRQAVLSDLRDLGTFVVSRLVPPQLTTHLRTNGCDIRFTPVQHCVHTLERSTNMTTWSDITTVTPTNTAPVTLQDNSAPDGRGFYRVRVNFP